MRTDILGQIPPQEIYIESPIQLIDLFFWCSLGAIGVELVETMEFVERNPSGEENLWKGWTPQ